MQKHMDAPVSVHDVLRCLVRHRRKIATVFLASLTVSIAWCVYAPRAYQSSVKLYVRLGRESVALDPTATTGQTVNLYQTRQSEINTILQMIDNWSIVASVVDAIGVDTFVQRPEGRDRGPQVASAARLASYYHLLADYVGQAGSAAARLDPESDRQRAIRKVQSSTTIWSPPDSSVIVIECRADSAALAQRIAQTWTSIFLREYARLTHTAGSFEFFDEQAAMLKAELTGAETGLRDARVKAGLLSVNGQQEVLERGLAEIRARMAVNASSLVVSKVKAEELGKKIATIPPQVIAQDIAGSPHQAWDMMREKLYETEMREQDLKAKYTAKHPLLTAVEEQRNELESILKSQPESRSQLVRGPNPIYEAIARELLEEQAAVASLTAEDQSLREQYAQIQKDFQTFNADATRIKDLERQVATLETKYHASEEKKEQARIDQALEQEQICSVNIVQPATYIEKPISPMKLVCLLVGAAIGLIGGVGLALATEYLDRSFVTSTQLEKALELPVLASLPRCSSSRFTWSVK